jgi:hypothetical protein
MIGEALGRLPIFRSSRSSLAASAHVPETSGRRPAAAGPWGMGVLEAISGGLRRHSLVVAGVLLAAMIGAAGCQPNAKHVPDEAEVAQHEVLRDEVRVGDDIFFINDSWVYQKSIHSDRVNKLYSSAIELLNFHDKLIALDSLGQVSVYGDDGDSWAEIGNSTKQLEIQGDCLYARSEDGKLYVYQGHPKGEDWTTTYVTVGDVTSAVYSSSRASAFQDLGISGVKNLSRDLSGRLTVNFQDGTSRPLSSHAER